MTAGDFEAHEVEQVVELSQGEGAVAVEERDPHLTQGPPVEGEGIVHHGHHRAAVGRGWTTGPPVLRRGPQPLVDDPGPAEGAAPPEDELGDLGVDAVEFVDDALSTPVEDLALDPGDAGGHAGDAPGVEMDPARGRGQGAVGAGVERRVHGRQLGHGGLTHSRAWDG